LCRCVIYAQPIRFGVTPAGRALSTLWYFSPEYRISSRVERGVRLAVSQHIGEGVQRQFRNVSFGALLPRMQF
jgi:hypothetical protein